MPWLIKKCDLDLIVHLPKKTRQNSWRSCRCGRLCVHRFLLDNLLQHNIKASVCTFISVHDSCQRRRTHSFLRPKHRYDQKRRTCLYYGGSNKTILSGIRGVSPILEHPQSRKKHIKNMGQAGLNAVKGKTLMQPPHKKGSLYWGNFEPKLPRWPSRVGTVSAKLQPYNNKTVRSQFCFSRSKLLERYRVVLEI